MEDGSCYIIVGYSGSGKTEIAGNIAMKFAAAGEKTALADIDIVNPYFRSRERRRLFENAGVLVYSSNFTDSPYEDTPGISAGIMSCFANCSRKNVIDVGGGPSGARILSGYKNKVPANYEMLMVVNANRYLTQDAGSTYEHIKAIERESNLRVTGLINNTHCCDETTAEDIYIGEKVVLKISAITGIPVMLSCYREALSGQIDLSALSGKPFPLRLHHRPGWMSF